MASENLTDQRVKTVTAPKGQRLEIRDTKQAGLVLRLSEAGVKSWSVLYRRKIDGKRRRVTLGEYPQVTLAQARDLALDVLSRVAKREDPAADHRRGTTGRPRTFQELADNYLENHAEPNKRSARIDRQILAKDVNPLIGGEPLESIKRADIVVILQRVAKRGKPIQANRTFEVIRGLYNWALGQGLVETTPCLGLKAPAAERSRDRVLSDDEILSFWERLPSAPLVWEIMQILKLCLVTGQRVSEVAGTPFTEIDVKKAAWHLPSERVKNSNAHEVPLSPLATTLFAEAKARAEDNAKVRAIAGDKSRKAQPPLYYFPSMMQDGPITGMAVSKAMKRSLKHLKIAQATPHDLRRTAATGMAKLGISRLVVDKVLNHVSADRGAIAGVYDRYEYGPEKRRALEAWADRVTAIIECKPEATNVVPFQAGAR